MPAGRDLRPLRHGDGLARSLFKPALYVKAHYNPDDNTLSVKTQEAARFIQVTGPSKPLA